MNKYLALDYGASKIGAAIGDSEIRIASPFSVLKNDKDILANISKIIKDEDITTLVVGVPQGLQNLKSKQYEDAVEFVNKLKDELGIDVVVMDEKMTSKQAGVLLKGTKHGGVDDDVAAMLILQSYLDAL